MTEQQIEQSFINTLTGLKYECRPEITDRAALEQNFREKFEALNRVRLTDGEFARLLDEIVTPDGYLRFKAGKDAAELALMEECAPYLKPAGLLGPGVSSNQNKISFKRH